MRKCPVDDFTLGSENYEGVTIDRCPHCQGVWLDKGELKAIQDNQDDDFRDVSRSVLSSATASVGMAQAETEKSRTCVSCDAKLIKREYNFASQIIIDNCPNGHGMWLDKTELSRLQTFFEDQQDFANIAETEILRELRAEGIKGFFARLLKL